MTSCCESDDKRLPGDKNYGKHFFQCHNTGVLFSAWLCETVVRTLKKSGVKTDGCICSKHIVPLYHENEECAKKFRSLSARMITNPRWVWQELSKSAGLDQ